jgi:phi13 family phage major tail protein
MAENKVQFNLKNVHFAVLTQTESGGVITNSWATPVAMPGAVSISLAAEGELSPFYADGIVYYRGYKNNGYSGTLEMARISDEFLQTILGLTLGSTSKVLTENANTEPAPFALLFEIDGDADEQKYVLYNCSVSRPDLNGATTTETKEPQTASLSVSAVPLPDGKVFARTTADTPSATSAGWFTNVFEEA